MKLRDCTESDIENITRLLKTEHLPFEDLHDHIQTLSIAEDKNGILIGGGAIEVYGEVALFRSLVINKENRNQHYGSIILKHIEGKGKIAGVKELYLLTENACGYFAKRGFTEIARSDVPIAIQTTTQYSGLCPASARVMRKFL